MRITLSEYFQALGRWFWVLIADVLGIIQDLLLDIPYLNRLPLEIWVFLFVVFLIIANIHAFHKVRVERDQYKIRLDQREELKLSLTTLARLRTEGVTLRNQGIRLSGEKAIAQWIGEVKNWEDSVKSEIQKLSPSQAEVFRTLDWVRIRFLPDTLPKDLQNYINMFSDELENLKAIIEKCDPIFGSS